MKNILLSLLVATIGTMVQGQDVNAGRSTFQTYCATCHGRDAQGSGPMASILLIEPSDLTQLQKESDGVFPRAGVIAKIDGRDPLLSHGRPMPVYGKFFEGKGITIRGEEGILIMTSQPIVDLIAYLESVQSAPQ